MKVLITGSSGLVGAAIIQQLQDLNIPFHILSTNINKKSEQNTFYWNLFEDFIDELALEGVTHVIHLAGASIGRKHWTSAYKKTLLESRVKTALMLQNRFLNKNTPLVKFVSASATGIYPDPSEVTQTEESPYGQGFLTDVCIQWEQAAKQFESIAEEVSMVRTGLVLSKKSGFLKALMMAAPLRILPILGNPQAIFSWIHPKDLAAIYVYLLINKGTAGAWNAVAPYPISQREMLFTIDKVTHQRHWNPIVPTFLLKWVLGEMSILPLTNQIVMPKRLQESNFEFQFPTANLALADLLSNP